jgi:hypothetical protein
VLIINQKLEENIALMRKNSVKNYTLILDCSSIFETNRFKRKNKIKSSTIQREN